MGRDEPHTPMYTEYRQETQTDFPFSVIYLVIYPVIGVLPVPPDEILPTEIILQFIVLLLMN